MLHRTKGTAEEEEEEEKEREKEAERQEEERAKGGGGKDRKIKFEMVAYACNLRTWETEAGGLASMRQE